MNTEEVIKNNILIAKFMGMVFTPTNTILLDKTTKPQRAFKPGDLDYHKNWNSLMPVVEKIQSIDITPPPNYRSYRIEIVVQGYVKISGFPMKTITTNVSMECSLIKAVYKAIVLFVLYKSKN